MYREKSGPSLARNTFKTSPPETSFCCQSLPTKRPGLIGRGRGTSSVSDLPTKLGSSKQLIILSRVDFGDINQFRRTPTDLRKYLKFSYTLKKEYGTIANFMLSERLKWTDTKARGAPFQYPEDYRILRNDWPYALEPQIVHLVCWVKFELAEDPTTHRSTIEAHQQIEDFVTRTFRTRMPEDSVVWFKNYRALKSVHELEHFHIMLNDPPKDFLDEVTGGDVPMVEKV